MLILKNQDKKIFKQIYIYKNLRDKLKIKNKIITNSSILYR